MLTQAEQNVLNTNLPMLETDFPYDRLYAEMVSSGILDESDKSKLNAEQNNIKRNRQFFNLIQSKPTGTFQRVCQLFSRLSTVNASIGVQLLHAIHQQSSTETTDQYDAPMASLDATRQVNVGKDDQKIQLEVKHHDDGTLILHWIVSAFVK